MAETEEHQQGETSIVLFSVLQYNTLNNYWAGLGGLVGWLEEVLRLVLYQVSNGFFGADNVFLCLVDLCFLKK